MTVFQEFTITELQKELTECKGIVVEKDKELKQQEEKTKYEAEVHKRYKEMYNNGAKEMYNNGAKEITDLKKRVEELLEERAQLKLANLNLKEESEEKEKRMKEKTLQQTKEVEHRLKKDVMKSMLSKFEQKIEEKARSTFKSIISRVDEFEDKIEEFEDNSYLAIKGVLRNHRKVKEENLALEEKIQLIGKNFIKDEELYKLISKAGTEITKLKSLKKVTEEVIEAQENEISNNKRLLSKIQEAINLKEGPRLNEIQSQIRKATIELKNLDLKLKQKSHEYEEAEEKEKIMLQKESLEKEINALLEENKALRERAESFEKILDDSQIDGKINSSNVEVTMNEEELLEHFPSFDSELFKKLDAKEKLVETMKVKLDSLTKSVNKSQIDHQTDIKKYSDWIRKLERENAELTTKLRNLRNYSKKQEERSDEEVERYMKKYKKCKHELKKVKDELQESLKRTNGQEEEISEASQAEEVEGNEAPKVEDMEE